MEILPQLNPFWDNRLHQKTVPFVTQKIVGKTTKKAVSAIAKKAAEELTKQATEELSQKAVEVIAESTTEAVSKEVTKSILSKGLNILNSNIPLISFLFKAPILYRNFNKGNYISVGIGMGSVLISNVPFVGPVVSIGLDIYNRTVEDQFNGLKLAEEVELQVKQKKKIEDQIKIREENERQIKIEAEKERQIKIEAEKERQIKIEKINVENRLQQQAKAEEEVKLKKIKEKEEKEQKEANKLINKCWRIFKKMIILFFSFLIMLLKFLVLNAWIMFTILVSVIIALRLFGKGIEQIFDKF